MPDDTPDTIGTSGTGELIQNKRDDAISGDPTKTGVHKPGEFTGESPLAIAARKAKERRAASASKDAQLKALLATPSPSPSSKP